MAERWEIDMESSLKHAQIAAEMLSTQKLAVDLWDKVYGRESGEAQDVDLWRLSRPSVIVPTLNDLRQLPPAKLVTAQPHFSR